jgi:hypothetical protein
MHGGGPEMPMVKFAMSVPKAMHTALEEEMKHRKLDTIQATIRSILAEYFRVSPSQPK